MNTNVKKVLILSWLAMTVLDLIVPWKPFLTPGDHVVIDLVVLFLVSVVLIRPTPSKTPLESRDWWDEPRTIADPPPSRRK